MNAGGVPGDGIPSVAAIKAQTFRKHRDSAAIGERQIKIELFRIHRRRAAMLQSLNQWAFFSGPGASPSEGWQRAIQNALVT